MRLIATILVFFAFIFAAVADQSQLFSPNTGTVSGVQLTNNYNNAINALNTCNSGTAAPTNQLSATPSAGNCWLNTNTAPYTLQIYDGTNWVVTAYLDATNHIWIPVVGGGTLATIASAATTNLCPSTVGASEATTVQVTGTTTITSFGVTCGAGQIKVVEFAGALTLTNGAALILPGGANITTAAGDILIATYISGTGWYVDSYQKASGAPVTLSGATFGSGSVGTGAQGYANDINVGLTGTVGSNNLTINIVTNDTGATPTTGDPVLIGFRNATLTTGQFTRLSVTGAVSFTINSGNTMGATNGKAFRLWIVAINNGGTVLVGAYNASTTGGCQHLYENALQTTGAGANGGSAAQTIQTSTSALTGVSVKIIGFMEWANGLTTAGTWATGPTTIQNFGPGTKAPCDIVANYYASAAGAASQAVTPNSAADLFLVQCQGDFTLTAATTSVTLFAKRGATTIGNTAYAAAPGSTENTSTITSRIPDLPNTTASTTYSCGASNGTIIVEEIFIEEIMGSLEPANDNAPLRMTG